MSDKPKRPWFRFHLLTAMLMMFAAGGIVWMNLRDDIGGYEEIRIGNSTEWHNFEDRYCGWPLCWHSHEAKVKPMHVVWMPLAEDGLVGLAILAAVALASEFLLRRRDAREP